MEVSLGRSKWSSTWRYPKRVVVGWVGVVVLTLSAVSIADRPFQWVAPALWLSAVVVVLSVAAVVTSLKGSELRERYNIGCRRCTRAHRQRRRRAVES